MTDYFTSLAHQSGLIPQTARPATATHTVAESNPIDLVEVNQERDAPPVATLQREPAPQQTPSHEATVRKPARDVDITDTPATAESVDIRNRHAESEFPEQDPQDQHMETIRQVIDWVVAGPQPPQQEGDMEGAAQREGKKQLQLRDEKQDSTSTGARPAPSSPDADTIATLATAAIVTETDSVSVSPAPPDQHRYQNEISQSGLEVTTLKTKESLDTAPIENDYRQTGHTSDASLAEESLSVSIGSIHVTVEAPPQNSPRPRQAVPQPRADAPSSLRLARHYLRVD